MESLLVASSPSPPASFPFGARSELRSALPGTRVVFRSPAKRSTLKDEPKARIGDFGGKGLSIGGRQLTMCSADMASESHQDSPVGISLPKNRWWSSITESLELITAFTRPFVSYTTALHIISVSVAGAGNITPLVVAKILEASVVGQLELLYVNGINQLSDIEIDKVNKPHLPLASGKYSVSAGVTIASLAATLSFVLAWRTGSWPLIWGAIVSFLVGTAYSVELPFLRWKRSTLMATISIIILRVLAVHIPFYLHAQTYMYGKPLALSMPILFTSGLFTVYSIVISFFKDIHDIEGDLKHGIQSFAARLGAKKMFWSCVWILQTAYFVTLVVGASSSYLWSRYVTIAGHTLFSWILWNRANSTDLTSKSEIQKFNVFIWQLFCAELVLLPMMRGL